MIAPIPVTGNDNNPNFIFYMREPGWFPIAVAIRLTTRGKWYYMANLEEISRLLEKTQVDFESINVNGSLQMYYDPDDDHVFVYTKGTPAPAGHMIVIPWSLYGDAETEATEVINPFDPSENIKYPIIGNPFKE